MNQHSGEKVFRPLQRVSWFLDYWGRNNMINQHDSTASSATFTSSNLHEHRNHGNREEYHETRGVDSKTRFDSFEHKLWITNIETNHGKVAKRVNGDQKHTFYPGLFQHGGIFPLSHNLLSTGNKTRLTNILHMFPSSGTAVIVSRQDGRQTKVLYYFNH